MKNEKSQNQSTNSKKAKDLGTYIIIGFIIGALIGLITDNLTLWTGTGMCLGIVIGAISGMRTDQDQE